MLIELEDVVRAIEDDAVVPFFQPIVNLCSGQITGFEVLARWQHPQLGFVLPQNFIALAEGNGLIGALTKQVFCKAFSLLPHLPEPLTLAVNVSPLQMQYVSFPTQIEELARDTGFPLQRLTIEITESALLNDFNRAKAIANQLKELGCKLALDDFGTGFSSLRHLQALPFDQLKIDRSFVAAMTTERESRKIVGAMVGLGLSLGLKTVAEGLETEDQVSMIVKLGGREGQGWLYGRPVSADGLEAVVKSPPRIVAVEDGSDRVTSSGLEAVPTHRLAHLQAIYDGAPVGLCFLDSELRYVNMNERLAKMNGKPVAAHLGRTVAEIHSTRFEDFRPYLERALKGEAIGGVQISRKSLVEGEKDITILASYQPAWDEAGEVVGISIAVVDITEHVQAAKRALKKGAVMSDMGAQQTSIPWVMDRYGRNLDADSRWEQTTRLSKNGVHNLSWLKTVHPDDYSTARRTMKIALRTGQPIDMDYRTMSPDGDWRWIHSEGSARFGPGGEITRWFGTTVDVDERKQIEEAHRRSNADILAVFEAVPLGLLVADGIKIAPEQILKVLPSALLTDID